GMKSSPLPNSLNRASSDLSKARCNLSMLPRTLRPMRLSRRPEPFDSDQFIFELKIDGFRALEHIQDCRGELVSRNGNTFRGFAQLAGWIAEHVKLKARDRW